MYTRSRSTSGGPGFGRGGQMNQGNGNFQGNPNQYNHQGGNMQPMNFKPGGIIQPDAPFKPAGQGQQMQQRPPQQQTPQPNQQQQQQQQGNQNQNQSPMNQKLKPILKQGPPTSGPGTVAPSTPTTGAPGAPTAVGQGTNPNAQGAQTPKPAIKTGPPVTPGGPGAVKGDAAAAKNAGAAAGENAQGEESMDDTKWIEEQKNWMETEEGLAGQWLDTDEDGVQLPKWRRFKKIAAHKPNKKLKRLRMNQRLRKTLMPKNAIMVLNEMKAGVQFTFPETQAIMPNSLFLVHAEMDGKVYVGQGLSKHLARQNAAENALKCLLLEKMTAAAMKERVDGDGDTPMEAAADASATPTEGVKDESKEENGEESAENDIPWSSLASFALHKLFLEWQNQGTVVPILRPGAPPLPKARADPKPPTEKALPPNALEIHPVMLLNQMRPGTTYNEVGRVGNPPNIQFTLGVEINGVTYTGAAKNKKDAKKIAAKEALKALYNLEYPEEPRLEVTEMAQ